MFCVRPVDSCKGLLEENQGRTAHRPAPAAGLRGERSVRPRVSGASQDAEPPRNRRVLSPEGRARIIAATKRRWAKARRAKK
jgi:hypothetical protein